MHIILDGKRWKIAIGTLPSEDVGLCDPPERPYKQITISREIDVPSKDLMFMETVLHELLHASCWNLDEECVEGYARAAAKTLHRLGFRRHADKSEL